MLDEKKIRKFSENFIKRDNLYKTSFTLEAYSTHVDEMIAHFKVLEKLSQGRYQALDLFAKRFSKVEEEEQDVLVKKIAKNFAEVFDFSDADQEKFSDSLRYIADTYFYLLAKKVDESVANTMDVLVATMLALFKQKFLEQAKVSARKTFKRNGLATLPASSRPLKQHVSANPPVVGQEGESKLATHGLVKRPT